MKAVWGEEGYSWTYETAIPHATFEILEDEEKYCRGIVFDIKDLASGEEQEKLIDVLKSDLPTALKAVLCISGETMDKTNADTMNTSVEANINGKRVKITAEIKIKEL